jgi:cytochrome c-type biogenesis protein CcmF
MGAIISRNLTSDWVKACDRITVFSWYWLGIGIWVGAIWAYVVLGWGGFWAWDPVENASMLPWFAGLGLIHSMTVYRRKGNMKIWTLMLAALTYVMVVVGTFIVRSGIIDSVHAFPSDPVARNMFLFLMLGTFAVMLVGVIFRRHDLKNNSDFESLTGKDAMYYINNVMMTLMTFILLFMTISPALTELANTIVGVFGFNFGPGRVFAISQYEVIARFLGIIYVAMIAICPMLNWNKTDGQTLFSRIWAPAAWSLLPFAGLVWIWWDQLHPVYAKMAASADFTAAETFTMYGPVLYSIIALVAFYLSCFLVVSNIALFVRGTKARMKATGEMALTAFGNILAKARVQSGGYISHLAVGLTVIGLVGSIMYVQSDHFQVPLEEGASVQISNYEFILEDFKKETVYDHDNEALKETARFAVMRDGILIGHIEPTRYYDPVRDMRRINASVKSEPLRDIFLTFGNSDIEETIPITVMINPLIWVMWIGSGLLLVGNALAAWPKPKTTPKPALASGSGKPKAAGGKGGGPAKKPANKSANKNSSKH